MGTRPLLRCIFQHLYVRNSRDDAFGAAARGVVALRALPDRRQPRDVNEERRSPASQPAYQPTTMYKQSSSYELLSLLALHT